MKYDAIKKKDTEKKKEFVPRGGHVYSSDGTVVGFLSRTLCPHYRHQGQLHKQQVHPAPDNPGPVPWSPAQCVIWQLILNQQTSLEMRVLNGPLK